MKRKNSVKTNFKGINIEKKQRVIKEEQKIKVESKIEEEKSPLTPEPSPPKISRTPKQDNLAAQMTMYVTEIEALKTLLAVPEPSIEHRVKLKKTVMLRENCLLELKRCKSLVRASRKQRRNKAAILNSSAKPLRPFPGRPPLEDTKEFAELPTLIVKIAQRYASADPKRRAEMLTLPKTLDDLVEALKKEGMKVERSALYMRLIPKRRNSSYGKRHVRVVPVQLRKPQYDGRKKHISARYCFATSLMLRELAS